jgi:IPT/TIG domain
MRGTPPAGALGDRALDAMAKAARRARLAEQAGTTAVEGTEPNQDRRAGTAGHRDLNEDDAPTPIERPAAASVRTGAEPLIASPTADLRSPRRRVPPKGFENVLRVCVMITAGLVVVLGALALGFGVSGDRYASSAAGHAVVIPRSNSPEVKRPASGSQQSSAGKGGGAQPSSGRSGGPSSIMTGPATATPPAPNPSASGSSPVVSAVTPDAGDAGQVVMVNGSNLFSPDENIQASFGGQPADISCPTQALCMMTVPSLAAPAGTISITVTTEAGTSDAIPFTYGSATTSSCGQCQYGGSHHRPSGMRPPSSH